MPAFRKKPVIIDAVQATERIILAAEVTLHGHDLIAEPGDWIIKGTEGEMYPCRDDIFRATYEPVGKEGVWALLIVPVAEATDREYIIPFPGKDNAVQVASN